MVVNLYVYYTWHDRMRRVIDCISEWTTWSCVN